MDDNNDTRWTISKTMTIRVCKVRITGIKPIRQNCPVKNRTLSLHDMFYRPQKYDNYPEEVKTHDRSD